MGDREQVLKSRLTMSLTLECDAYRKRAQEKLYLVAEIRSELNFDQTVGDCPTLWDVLPAGGNG